MGLEKFDFSVKCKTNKAGKISRGLGGSWQMLPSAWNQRTHLKILSAQVRTWQVAGTLKVAWTCSICPTLWLLMFPRLSPAARQLRWCLDIPWGCCPLFPGHWYLEAIRRFVLSGGHFPLLVTGSAEPFLLIILFKSGPVMKKTYGGPPGRWSIQMLSSRINFARTGIWESTPFPWLGCQTGLTPCSPKGSFDVSN